MNRKDGRSTFEDMMTGLGDEIGRAVNEVCKELGTALSHMCDEIEKELNNFDLVVEELGEEEWFIKNKTPLNLDILLLQGILKKNSEPFISGRYCIKMLEDVTVIPIRELEQDDYCGGIIIGDFELIADMVIHTKNGAVGQSINRTGNAAIFITPNFAFPDVMIPIEESDLIIDQTKAILDQF
ncbi:MAG: hypothetical protein ACFFCQ_15185, partial [Promethearchaeota archaeon]